MRVLQAAIIFVALVAGKGCARFIDSRKSQPGLSISTSSGIIHGKIDVSNPNVRQFLGIPFAQPPLGDLRWAAPQPLPSSASKQSVQATSLPRSCLQYLSPGASVYTRNVLQFNLQGLNRTGDVGEDCLTLSVWTPTLSETGGCDPEGKRLLPVLVFIYGGGFSTGGQDVPYQIPTQWVQRTKGHLVVSFNYRLGIFGYPNAAGLNGQIQNVGLLDQRAAVEWLRENIAQFGGDPDRMVLWGQSAGSESVDYYNFAYPSDPIVKGLIMDSGTASMSCTDCSDQSNFTFVAEHVGCSNLASSPKAQLACMRRVDASAIEGFIADYSIAGRSPGISWSPHADNKTVFANYTQRALEGRQALLPAIIGTNAQDGVAFVAYNPNGPNTTQALAYELNHFFCPGTKEVEIRQNTNRTTFKYYYGGNFSNISPTDWLGAYHSSELPMLFGTYGDYRGPSSPLEVATSEAMQDAYLAFAAGGASGLDATGWKSYNRLGEATARNFGNASTGAAAQDISLSFLEDSCS